MEIESEGQKFTFRQLNPDDAASYLEFFNGLDEETIRCRFGYMIAALALESAKRIASMDPVWRPALAAFTGNESRIVAVGRFNTDDNRESAEVAVVVDSGFRRLGLARLLMNQLIELAHARQIMTLHAYVASKRIPVYRMLQSCGFEITSDPGDDLEEDHTRFTLDLSKRPNLSA